MAKAPTPKSDSKPDAPAPAVPSAPAADSSAPPQDAPVITTEDLAAIPKRMEPEPELERDTDLEPSPEFRRAIAAVQPGATKFGQMPAAKMRLNDALSRLINGHVHLQQAKDILDSLKAEKVTGSDQTGAQSILGDDLPQYELLIQHAEQTFQFLRGELTR